MRTYTSTPATIASGAITLTALFPFKTEYGVFTGGCEEANPTNYDADYFPNYTGSVTTDPGVTDAVTVRQPPLNFRVRARDGSRAAELRAGTPAPRVARADRRRAETTK